MKALLSALACVALLATGVVHAHAHLHRSIPANNSTITEVPKNLTLEFNEAVKLTALTLQKGGEQAHPLVPLPEATAKEITAPLPSVSPGNYVVKWRAVSADNHIMSGKLLFTVAAAK